MTYASEVRFRGVPVRDAELAYTPDGHPVATVDVAVDEGGRTVYVPVRLEGELAREVCAQSIMHKTFMVWGHLWRPAKTEKAPYPPLTVVAHMFRRILVEDTGSLFENRERGSAAV